MKLWAQLKKIGKQTLNSDLDCIIYGQIAKILREKILYHFFWLQVKDYFKYTHMWKYIQYVQSNEQKSTGSTLDVNRKRKVKKKKKVKMCYLAV